MPKLVKKPSGPDQEQGPDFLPNVRRIASLAYDYKAKNIIALDVSKLTVLTNCFVLCSVTSEPQLKAVYNAVKEGMKEIGVAPYHSEGAFTANWLVLDFGDILFHVFREKAYEFYDLGGLWGDAPQVDLDLDEE